ncbi:hypothetical protein ACIQWZ_10615 [Streptomyces sp. NPDC098077]|uniref:hypothetical protein n=1 Tax=Streptomyces sp. NPDC098077 TaxID=3366093 RepID=UPI0037F434FE
MTDGSGPWSGCRCFIVLKDAGSAAARQSVLEVFHRLGTTGEGVGMFRQRGEVP